MTPPPPPVLTPPILVFYWWTPFEYNFLNEIFKFKFLFVLFLSLRTDVLNDYSISTAWPTVIRVYFFGVSYLFEDKNNNQWIKCIHIHYVGTYINFPGDSIQFKQATYYSPLKTWKHKLIENILNLEMSRTFYKNAKHALSRLL